jgi:hypothetical protein
MKCPKCNKEGFRYDESFYRKKDGLRKGMTDKQRKILWKRTNFHGKCKNCGWKGEY